MQQALRHLLMVLRAVATLAVLMALAFVAFVELLIAYPVPGQVYLALAVLLAVLLIRPGTRAALRSSGILLACLWTAMALMYLVDWTTRKPFLRDLDRIQPGMTEREVRGIMGKYIEGSGLPANPFGTTATLHLAGTGLSYAGTATPTGQLAIADSIIFRHATGGNFDSDWGIVHFRGGRVVDVTFSPD